MDNKVYRSELTPVDFLRRSAYMFPEKTAVVYGDRRHTYAEFEERVNRLTSRLRDSGLKKGDRVAFLCPNTPPHLEATFAVPAAGLVLVAINTRLGKDEVTYIVEHSGAKMVFVDTEPLGMAPLEAVRRLEGEGVGATLVSGKVRMVTHVDIADEDVETAVAAWKVVVAG